MSKPELFVEPDPELPLALLDQKEVLLVMCYILHDICCPSTPYQLST